MTYPFSAIVGQESMKNALLMAAIDPTIGGVLIFGDRGTGKSTAVRALASLLPKIDVVDGCAYGCAPVGQKCKECPEKKTIKTRKAAVPVVDLPLGATEDRVVGALNIEKALSHGEKSFEPGLLARANRGFLYIDEVNLLEDHLVDVLLDVAASGKNVVEREGLSLSHPARFVLVGSGNPEEGELRPQLLDRFGLSVDVSTPTDLKSRIEVVRRRDAYERDPDAFIAKYKRKDAAVRKKVLDGRARVDSVEVPDNVLESASNLCMMLGTDGLRGELTLMRAARALAALSGDEVVNEQHLRDIAPSALSHRLRRNPLDDTRAVVRVERLLEEHLAAA